MTIPFEIREVLEKRFEPGECSIHPYHKWTYVEGHRVIHRLNDAFEGGWSHTIINRWREGDTLMVTVRVTADMFWMNEHGMREETTVSHEGFGSADVKFRKCKARTCDICPTNPNHMGPVDIGGDWKAAATDGLKKASTHFGVALHLYDGADAIHHDTREAHHRRKGERMTPNFNTSIGGGPTPQRQPALPAQSPPQQQQAPQQQAAGDIPQCEKCGSDVWNNREKCAGGWRGPVFKCKDRACDWVKWKEKTEAPPAQPNPLDEIPF